MWPVRSIIVGLISFFVTEDNTVGAIRMSFQEREKICNESKELVLQNDNFKKLF